MTRLLLCLSLPVDASSFDYISCAFSPLSTHPYARLVADPALPLQKQHCAQNHIARRPPLPRAEIPPSLSVAAGEDPAVDGSRHNTAAKYEEGITNITPALREAAARANVIDEALHEFVSAKFCERLRDVGLLEHPLVAEELASFEVLDQR